MRFLPMIIDPVKVQRERPGSKDQEPGKQGYPIDCRQVAPGGFSPGGDEAGRLSFGRLIDSLGEAAPGAGPKHHDGECDATPADDERPDNSVPVQIEHPHSSFEPDAHAPRLWSNIGGYHVKFALS